MHNRVKRVLLLLIIKRKMKILLFIFFSAVVCVSLNFSLFQIRLLDFFAIFLNSIDEISMEMRVVVCTSGAGMVRGAEIVGTGAERIEVIYVVVLRIVSVDGAIVGCCQNDTSRSIHFRHLSFCIFYTYPSTVRVAQE